MDLSTLPEPEITSLSQTILEQKILHRHPDGTIKETPKEMFWRVASHIAEAECQYNSSSECYAQAFYEIMASRKFLPNSPCLVGAKTKRNGLFACYVLHPEDSMESIFETLKEMAIIHASGGGTGFPFHLLRPSDDFVSGTRGGTTGGPLSFMETYNTIADVVRQGGTRRGASMGVMGVWHPNIMDFIRSKSYLSEKNWDLLYGHSGLALDLSEEQLQVATRHLVEGQFSNFNISVGITDKFMQAVEQDGLFSLRFPEDGPVYQTIAAREIFQALVDRAWQNGEPGVFFLDTARRNDPELGIGTIQATNPCLSGNTIMLTRQGLQPIAALAGSDAEFWTPLGWRPGRAWKTGRKAVIQVTLSNGQQITATPDHRFMVGDEWVEAQQMLGTKIEPLLGQGNWIGDDSGYTHEDLVRLGFLQGDGNFQENGGIYANLGYWDSEVEPLFSSYKRHGTISSRYYIPLHDPLVYAAERLGLLRLPLPERTLPSGVWTLSPDGARSFLKGLFSANGIVIRRVGRITLKTSCKQLAEEVQLLLLALGFRPYIISNHPHDVQWPNGTFTSRRSYDLNITSSELRKFCQEIGFIQAHKTQALETIRMKQGRRILPTVVAIEPLGEHDVYDFSVEDLHAGWANGFYAKNCGEQPLHDGQSCVLGSINLERFLKPETETRLPNSIQTTIDWAELGRVVSLGVRFLDDCIDMNQYPIEKIERVTRASRPIGLGIMGWHSLLMRMGIPYESDEALRLAARIMTFIHEEAISTSELLANQRGPCLIWKDTRWAQLGYPPRRNSRLTTAAPTGSLSLIAHCSPGIEPVFGLASVKHLVDGPDIQIVDPVFKDYLQQRFQDNLAAYQFVLNHALYEGSVQTLKAHLSPHERLLFKNALEIDWHWHLAHQAAFQNNGVEAGCSKTINMKYEATPGDVSDAIFSAWYLGIIGFTIYRNGSRQIQPLQNGSACTIDPSTGVKTCA